MEHLLLLFHFFIVLVVDFVHIIGFSSDLVMFAREVGVVDFAGVIPLKLFRNLMEIDLADMVMSLVQAISLGGGAIIVGH